MNASPAPIPDGVPSLLLPSRAAPRPLSAGASTLLSPGRILVVDDDALIRDTLAEALHLTGYQVICAEDGEAGWNALSTQPVHLLVTDYEMPRLTGLDLLRRIRPSRPTLPVIMISGKIQVVEPELRGLLKPGAALPKPFALAELLAWIRHFLFPSRPPFPLGGRAGWGVPGSPLGGPVGAP